MQRDRDESLCLDMLVSLHLSPEEVSEYVTVKERLDTQFIARRNVIFVKFNQQQQETDETPVSSVLHCVGT